MKVIIVINELGVPKKVADRILMAILGDQIFGPMCSKVVQDGPNRQIVAQTVRDEV